MNYRAAIRTQGGDRVTILDVAAVAGVSKSTVSLVLNDSPAVRADTRAKVQRAMGALGYVYHRGAASLRQKSSDMIGLVINDLTNPFFAEFAVGVESVLQNAGAMPVIAHSNENALRQMSLLRSMHERGAAGFILSPAVGTDRDKVAEIAAWRAPLIFAMRRVAGLSGVSFVLPDNRRGGALAVAHLIELGHKRIAFIGGVPDMVAQQERLAGYRDALEAAGLPFDPALVVQGLPTRDGGVAGVTAVLALADPPTAALSFNDIVAVGVIQGLAARGLRYGCDFGVVGFDDVSNGKLFSPPLTTIAVDAPALGERAAQMLLRMIHSGDRSPRTYVGPVQLVVRQTCGALPAREET